jgi:transcription antitermination factor NusB
MTAPIPKREDRRRELSLWVIVAADACGLAAEAGIQRFERAFVGPIPPASASEASAHYRVERFEDFLPNDAGWAEHRSGVLRVVQDLEDNTEEVDLIIQAASPRWRLERMPMIDRALLRIGVSELLYADKPRPRATINGLIELAKRYGSPTTPAFVNGILDQIRRDREIPFS